jgi:hypothetical protein
MDRGLCNAIVHEVADAMSCDDGVVLYDAVGDNYGCGRSCCVVAMNGGEAFTVLSMLLGV